MGSAQPTGAVCAGWLLLAGLYAFLHSVLPAGACEAHSPCLSEVEQLLEAERKVRSRETPDPAPSGISISVDGETIVGGPVTLDHIHRTDKALEKVDIQVKFDGLDLTRRLNVTTADIRRTYRPGETVTFVASWNYPEWIERAEIRFYRKAEKHASEMIALPIEVVHLPVDQTGRVSVDWHGPRDGLSEDAETESFSYVLRVYDHAGRFDETQPLALQISDRTVALEDRLDVVPVAPGEGDDRTGLSNIPLHGGAVTVYGRHVPPGYTVHVMGEPIAVDANQRFVVSRILPPGDHAVDVSVKGMTKDGGLEFERDIHIPDNEWFYVGIADLTVGRRFGSDAEALAEAYPGEFAGTYRRGRLAFYLKGKIKGETLLTAAFDTTEDDLDNLLRNLNEKDPRQLLRNLDPDDYYPVYGDDSTLVEDAPTSGQFYVRLQRGKSHVMWGNYKTRIGGTELARYERSLYGGHAVLRSGVTTSLGEPVAKVEAFAAEPGSLPQRDEFRGTGGSAYFLRRQDINQGSEQISIEVRNRVTGLTVSKTVLRPDEDYEIDYVQGVVLLRRPLQSTVPATGAVKQTAIGGDEQYLVAVYEYTPTLTDLEGFTYGGRAIAWLNDHFRVGTTAYVEDTGFADQTMFGADVLIRISEKSFFEFEWAQSEGDTFGYVRSTDGGLVFSPQSGTGNRAGSAEAWRGKVVLDLGEVTGGAVAGNVGGYYEERDAGFNAPGRYTTVGERLHGVFADIAVSEDTSIRAAYEDARRDDDRNLREASAELVQRIDRSHTFSIGVTHSDEESPVGSDTGFGKRTDVGMRLVRELGNGEENWIFGQMTVDRDPTRDRNDRGGVGLKRALTDKISASAEVSYGTSGIGGLAALEYAPNADDRYYLGYRLDPDTTAGDLNGYDPFGRDYGAVVFGAKHRFSEEVTAYFEENYDFTGTQRSLTHTYGVTYTPDDAWSLSGGLEAGEVYDTVSGDFDRIAVSGTLSLREEARNAALRFEARFEDGVSASARDRNTYLLAASYGYRHNDDWRFIASLDAVVSESGQSTFLDGDYIEGSVGWAYRPTDDDRLNALFRYTYLEDLPGADQVNAHNELLGPRQRSHVLEGDFIYDLTERLSVGGKYGYRTGEIAVDRASSEFTRSSAHLAVARADLHVVDKWDLLLEARALWLSEAEQVNIGYLAGIYYHLSEHARIGVGYNFGRYTDDLTDFSQDNEGVFINLVGKF